MSEPFSEGIINAFRTGQAIRAQREEAAQRAEDRKLEREVLQHRIRSIKLDEQFDIRKQQQGQGSAMSGTDPITRLPRNVQDSLRKPAVLPDAPAYNAAQPSRLSYPSAMRYLPMQIDPVNDPDTGEEQVSGSQMPIPTLRDQMFAKEMEFRQGLTQKKIEREELPKFSSGAMGIVNEYTGEQTTPPAPKLESQPSSVQEYLFQVKEDIAAGRKPPTFDEYQIRDANRKKIRIDFLGNGDPPHIATRAATLAAQWDSNPVIKNYNEQWNRVAGVKAILSRPWSGPGDMATVFEFMKALDPTSVVRESEYATAAKTGNIFSGWAAKFNGSVNPEGGFLSDQVKKDFIGVLEKRVEVSKGQVRQLHRSFSRRVENITGRKGSGAEYLTDYSTVYGEEGGGDIEIVRDANGRIAGIK